MRDGASSANQRRVRRADRLALTAAALILLLSATACSYGAYFLRFDEESPESRAKSALTLNDDDLPPLTAHRYSFVIITDTHFGASKSRNDDKFIAWLDTQLDAADEGLRPRFVVNLGDTLDSGRDGQADDYIAFCEQLQETAARHNLPRFPVYAVLGNHDTYNNGWEVWKRRVYPYTSYYTFTTADGFSYYFLDSGNGTLGEAQLNDVIARMKDDPRPKLVFTHYPIYGNAIYYFTLQDTMERNLLIDAFARNNVRYIFAGHDHKDHRNTFKDDFREHDIASFLYSDVCSLVTIDETTGGVTSKNIDF